MAGITADPFVLPIPKKILDDPELRPFFEFWVDWSRQMWEKVGGGDDFISDQDVAELFPWGGQSEVPDNAKYPFSQAAPPPDAAYKFAIAQEIANRYAFSNTAEQQVANFYRFDAQRPEQPFFSVSANHTCRGSESVEATSNITVYLDATPDETTQIWVKRNTGAGTVTVDGNGINIDGAATSSFATNYDAGIFIYSPTSNEYLQF